MTPEFPGHEQCSASSTKDSLVSDFCTDAHLFQTQRTLTASFQKRQITALVFRTLSSSVDQSLSTTAENPFSKQTLTPASAELFSRLQLSVLPPSDAPLFPMSSAAQISPFILVCLAARPVRFLSVLQGFSLLHCRGYFCRSYELFCTVHLPWRKTLL